MGYKYFGAGGLVKTGEVITVLPSGLIQKKVTVVGRKVASARQGINSPKGIAPLSENECLSNLDGFFPFPINASGSDLNNGFIQYDIVGYDRGFARGINYKYLKLSSFVTQDIIRPRTTDFLAEVGVASSVVLSDGTKIESQDEKGNTVNTTSYEKPGYYNGSLIAYDASGQEEYVPLINYENIGRTEAGDLITERVEYRPVRVNESVSATYYGHFTEYITTATVKMARIPLPKDS